MKTITISDDTYKRLESAKAGRSFSETIDSLVLIGRVERMELATVVHFYNLGQYLPQFAILAAQLKDIPKNCEFFQSSTF